MDGDNDLCYRWWEADHLEELEKPLMTDAINLAPASLSLLTMLTALSGHRPPLRRRLREDGLSEEAADDDDDAGVRDARVCASQVYRTLLSLHSYTVPAQPSSYYAASPPSAAAFAGWTLCTTQPCVTADGVHIPAGVLGRVLRGDFVQWRLEWSGWAALVARPRAPPHWPMRGRKAVVVPGPHHRRSHR